MVGCPAGPDYHDAEMPVPQQNLRGWQLKARHKLDRHRVDERTGELS
jgi:hypothetical protein